MPKVINDVILLKIDMILPNPSQPRRIFNDDDIRNLADSIKENGLLQPITVRKKNQYFEIISGERRLRAAKLLGKDFIQSIVIDTTNEQSAIFSLLENLQREDLNCFEEAIAIKRLIQEWGFSQIEIGKKLGKAQSTIANKLRLLRFDDITKIKLLENNIPERQIRAFLRIEDEKIRNGAIDYIIAKKMNVNQTECYISNLINNKKKPKRNIRPILKDVRIFVNTLNNAVNLMNASGINASCKKIESDNFTEYIVKIPVSKND